MADIRTSPGSLPASAESRRREPIRPGPLAGRYIPSAAMVVLFLVPYLGLSASLQPLTPIIATQLHVSPQTISLAYGLGNAGYAVGTILAVQLAQHLPQRRMLVVYASLLVIGSVLAAAATGRIRPASGRRSPWMHSTVVVLPAPFAPVRPTISPPDTSGRR